MNPSHYNNKNRNSPRLKNWDYGTNASYFVTICTRNRENFFGDIVGDKMLLSDIGQEAEKYWQEIPDQFPFVILGEHIVMPNHVHGIVIIDKPCDGHSATGNDAINHDAIEKDAINCVPTVATADGGRNRQHGGITGKHNPMMQENLSRILRWYKGRVTFETRKLPVCFSLQPRFHDHIIRDEAEFERISHYIITNPSNWDKDKFHSK